MQPFEVAIDGVEPGGKARARFVDRDGIRIDLRQREVTTRASRRSIAALPGARAGAPLRTSGARSACIPHSARHFGQRNPLVALRRVERDRLAQRRDGFVEPPALPLGRRAHHPARTESHVELERRRQRLHRFLRLALPVANDAEIVMSQLVIGLQADSLHHRLLGFGESAGGLERVAEVVPCARIVGLRLQRVLEAAAGAVEIACGRIEDAHQVVRLGVLRRQANGIAQRVERGFRLAGGVERLREREMRGGIVGALREGQSRGIDFCGHGMVRKSARSGRRLVAAMGRPGTGRRTPLEVRSPPL